MAKITELPSSGASTSTSLPRLLILSTIPFSLLLSLFIHFYAVYYGPGDFVPSSLGKDIHHVRNLLHLPRGWGQWALGNGDAGKFFLFLVAYFKDMLKDKTGSGLLLVLLAIGGAVTHHMAISTLRFSAAIRHPWTGTPWAVLIIGSIGQGTTFASAVNALWVPFYAWARLSESSIKRPYIHPSPSPSAFHIGVGTFSSVIAITLALSTLLLPTTHEWWITSNVLFQLFPLGWLPLIFLGASKAAKGKSVRPTGPRLWAAQSYQLTSYALVLMHWIGTYLCYAGLKSQLSAWKEGKTLAWPSTHGGGLLVPFTKLAPVLTSDGQHLLFYDYVGILFAAICTVLIDSLADEIAFNNAKNNAKLTKGEDGDEHPEDVRIPSGVRVHDKRNLLADMFAGVPVALVLGPGWGLCKYWQRREIMAEKARFEARGWEVKKKE